MQLLQISLQQTITLGQALTLLTTILGAIIWLIKIITTTKVELENVKLTYIEMKKDIERDLESHKKETLLSLNTHEKKTNDKFQELISVITEHKKETNNQYIEIIKGLGEIKVSLANKQNIKQS